MGGIHISDMASPLLQLPRELRDQIILLVLLSPRPVANSPADSLNRSRLRVSQNSDAETSLARDTWVFVEDDLYTGLSLACRQLRYETQLARARLEAGDRYHLDVMFVKEAGLWSTWAYAPTPVKHIDTLYTTFRIFGVPKCLEEDDDWCNAEQFRGGFRNISPHAMNYFDLLSGYLQYGAGSRQASRAVSRANYTVGTLIIDVLLPNEVDAQVMDHPPLETRARDARDRLSGDVFTPNDTLFARKGHWLPGWYRSCVNDPPALFAADKLAYFLWSHICLLASLQAPYVKYSRLLFDGVGSIELRVAGQKRKELQLWTEAMRPIPRVPPDRNWPAPGEKWWRRLGEWKTEVVQRRRQRGLQKV